MKVLITGITGFAGTHLAEHLLACGDEVLGCSQGGTWSDAAPSDLTARVRLLRWEMTVDPSEEVRCAIAEFAPEVVYHLAGLSVPARCGRTYPTPEAMVVNVMSVQNVIRLSSDLRDVPRVLIVSSRHVYGVDDRMHGLPTCALTGTGRETGEPPGSTVSETASTLPQSGYGKTKLAAEWLAREMMEAYGVEIVIARAVQPRRPSAVAAFDAG